MNEHDPIYLLACGTAPITFVERDGVCSVVTGRALQATRRAGGVNKIAPDLSINMQTARALDIVIPDALFAQAERVIE